MKPFDQLFAQDPANAGFVVRDPTAAAGYRPLTAADRYASAARLALPATAPDDVRGYFETARTLWVYGWLHYPLYTWAGLHAGICVEMALKHRVAAEGLPEPRHGWTLQRLLETAVARRWVRARDFPDMPAVLARRREMEHILRVIAAHEAAAQDAAPGGADGVTTPTVIEIPDLGDAEPEPGLTDEELTAILATRLDATRELRNEQAHASSHSYGTPDHGLVMLTLALT